MRLTKTDFLRYLHCPKSLWILKREPENDPQGDSSAFDGKRARDGYEIERHVRQLLESTDCTVNFQQVFETGDGLYARADAVERTANGETVLHEIKFSTRVKDNHVRDACFQKICAERAGQQIDRVSLIHLNGDYVREGEIDPGKLLIFADITGDVDEIEDKTIDEIGNALEFLASEIDRDRCSCLENSRGNHCETFAYFNPGVPKPSIYSLPRLSAGKREELVSRGIFSLGGIPDDFGLTEPQGLVCNLS